MRIRLCVIAVENLCGKFLETNAGRRAFIQRMHSAGRYELCPSFYTRVVRCRRAIAKFSTAIVSYELCVKTKAVLY